MTFDCLTMVDDVSDNSIDIWWMYSLGGALASWKNVVGNRRCQGRLLNAKRRGY